MKHFKGVQRSHASLASLVVPQLPRLVAENVLSFDQKMWMRIAARSDAAESMDDKEKFASLASKLMGLVEAMVQQTESTIQESSKLLVWPSMSASRVLETLRFDIVEENLCTSFQFRFIVIVLSGHDEPGVWKA